MSTTVDSLDIQLQMQSQRAVTSIDTLISRLGTLNASLTKINGSGLTGVANGVNKLSSAMQGLKSVGAVDYNRLAKGIEKISSLDNKQISSAATALKGLGKGLESLNSASVSGTAEQVAELAKSISRFGYTSSKKAIDNIPHLANAMKDLMTSLSKAPRVSQNLIDMTNALAKLARTGASSGKAATSLSRSLDTYTKSTGKASSGTKGLASALGKMYASYWLLFRAFQKIGQSITLASDLVEVQNVVNTVFGDMTAKVEQYADKSIKQFGMSELAFKQYASRFQAMGTAMGIDTSSIENANKFLNKSTGGYVALSDSMADVSLTLTQLTADMASFYNVEQAAVAEDLAAIFTGETRPLRTYGLDLTQATLSEWAMKQGLDANIQSMSQAEKTMLRYQYVLANTTAAQGDFARTANTWANQVRILQEQLKKWASVIGTGFIAAFKPFLQTLNTVMGKVIDFTENVLNALGNIFGWKFEISGGGITDDLADSMGDTAIDTGDAAGSAGDLSDNLGDAASNAKKLYSTVLGIDELNINNPNTGSTGSGSSGNGGSGGSGSGGGSGSTGDGLTTTISRNDAILKAYESSIDTLYELGDYIGDTLTKTLNSIDWDSVYQGARNFGKGLADFLNGLISPELFGAVGRTIAGALNTAIYAALSFGETFDFYDFGVSIATGINEFFRTFDFGALAQTLNVWVDGLINTIAGFLNTISWSDILKAAGNFLGNIELDTVSVIIGGFALKHGMQKLTASTLKNAILGKLDTLLIAAFGSKAGIVSAGFAIAGTIYLAFEFAEDAKEWWNNIQKYGWDEGRRVTAENNPANPYRNGTAVVQEGDLTWFDQWGKKLKKWQENNRKARENEKSEFFGFASGIAEKFGEAWQKIQEFFSPIGEWFGNRFEDIKNAFFNAPEYFGEVFKSAYQKIIGAFQSVGIWFHERFEDIKNAFFNAPEYFGEVFKSAYQKVADIFSSIGLWFYDRYEDIKNVFLNLPEFFKEKFQGAYDKVTGAFQFIATWFHEKWDAVKGVFNDVQSFFKNGFQKAYDAVRYIWNGLGNFFKGVAENAFKPIKSLVNGVIKGINWVLETVGSGTRVSEWEGIKFAKGSDGIPQNTLGIVNDQPGSTYKELIVPPSGKPFIPEGRNVMLPLEKGTKIMPAKQTKAFMSGMPHFAGGIGDFFGNAWEAIKNFTGDVWNYLTNPGDIVKIAIDKFVGISGFVEPWLSIAGGMVNKTLDSIISFVTGIFDTVVPKVNYSPSAGVEQWRNLAAKALQMTGQYSASNLNLLLYQMQTESGGNPNAINDWDINAKNGTPSKGLMQVIDPTFKAYAMKGYNTNIYDPLSNMIAAIRYTVSRYGSLANGWKGHGYANGIGKINLSDLIPAYEVGGFPEDGLFFANHNELVGQFDNGRTVVANNTNIQSGIKEGVKEAVAEILAPYLQQIADNTRETADKDFSFDVDGRSLVSAYDRRKNRNGFSFT